MARLKETSHKGFVIKIRVTINQITPDFFVSNNMKSGVFFPDFMFVLNSVNEAKTCIIRYFI